MLELLNAAQEQRDSCAFCGGGGLLIPQDSMAKKMFVVLKLWPFQTTVYLETGWPQAPATQDCSLTTLVSIRTF